MLEREEFLETDPEMMTHGQMIPKEVVSAETNMERRRQAGQGKVSQRGAQPTGGSSVCQSLRQDAGFCIPVLVIAQG